MNKKRGMLIVVLVILLVMFKIGYALNSHKSTLVSLRLMTDPHVVADHQIDDDVYTCEDRELICYNKNEKYDPDWNSGCDFLSQGSWPLEFPAAPNANVEKECSVAFQNAPLPRYNAPSDKGCWIFAADYDLWLDPGSASDDNECAFAQAREGIVIDGSKFSSFELYGIRSFSSSDNYEYWKIGGKYKYNDEKPNSYCLIKSYKWKWDKQESYMCADDHYWHACRGDEEDLNDLGSLTWASDYIYNCTRDKDTNLPVWKLMGEDKDQDGYTTENDCADDPKDPILQQTDCPELDIETGEINCEPYQQYSKCAICINPDAPEVCGDELNNDCRFGSGFSADSLENTKDETSDDCNKFKEGCEQGFKETKEEKGEGNCNPPSEPKEGEEEKDYSIYDNKQSACENAGGTWKPAEGKQHFNVLGEEFSWVNTPEGGYCCGINGTDDLGHIESNLDGENFVCLNKAEELVGTSENIEDLNWGTEQTPCSNWCWVKASAGNVLFKILTIKKPGEPAFDVVSNSDKWFSCDENIETLEEPNTQGEGEENFIELANRFYCYQEGKHWSWTECYGKNEFTKNENIKGRLAGEGLYSLYLVAKDENANGEVFDRRIELNTGKGDYEKFYGEADFDFSSYDYLEFMLKFVADEQGTSIEKLDDLVLPLNVSLEIRGRPEKVDEKGPLLFQGNALGYVINNPSFTGEDWMHIRIPIDNTLQGIQKIVIETKSDKNYIGVKNIRLTKSSGDDSKLCSGQDSTVDNSWLDDLDQGGKTITGENLCKALYGEEAWFGDDGEIDSSQDSANCCGNNENEYYAGKSKDVVIIEEDSSSEPKKYGCWNSQTVASGNTIMDVKFNVDIYKEKNFTVTPNPIELDNIIDVTYEVNDKSKDIPCNFPTELQYGEDFKQLCSPFKIKDLSNAVYGNTSVRIDYKPSDKYRLVFYDLITFEEIGYHFDEDEDPDHPEPYHIIDNETAQELWYHPIAVFVEIKEGVYFDITSKPSSNEMPEKQVTYSCTEDECLYPLPGEPPYTITNPFPHVYELYFVTGPQKEDEVLIEGTYNTNEYGNLKARKIAQQVVFYNEGEDVEITPGFYGCQSADFIETNLPFGFTNFENKPYCSIIGNNFCSPSVEQEYKKEKFTTINSWSTQEITKIGYDTKNIQYPENENVSSYNELIELKLLDKTISPEERNSSVNVLPARNIFSNAEFKTSATEIPHWEIFENGVLSSDENKHAKSGKVTLAANEILRSERIAVEDHVDFYITQEGKCTPDITLANKDGVLISALEPQFNSGDASYVVIEYVGPCDIEKPMLQRVDDLGPTDYYYNSQHSELGDYDSRAGKACCPENYCWNGYVCAKPMTELSSISEHVSEGRDYRCVDGQWKKSPLRWDWNADKWGFCERKDQCFVLSSEFANVDNTANDFYEGNYPLCINNTQSIFDHYCDNGKWTSRTKYLATKLIEVAENDDYTIYCAPYREILPDFEDKENYIGGELAKTEQKKQGLGEVPKEPEVLATCSSMINDPEGKRLVPDEENTCVNNVCVLKYKESGKFKVAFATTLNKPLDDPNSFLISFDIPQNKASQVCTESQGKFIECNLKDLNFPSTAKMWYSSDLNGLIYAKEGISINPSLTQKILNWFSNLFGIKSELSDEEAFVKEAENFKDLYINKNGQKKVRALKEVFPNIRQTLIAEYENFETPVCDYVNNIKLPPELQKELLEEVSDMDKLSCTTDNVSKQRVEMIAGLEYFWPQLTGRLRID